MRREPPLNRIVLVEETPVAWQWYARSVWIGVRNACLRSTPEPGMLPTRHLVRARVRLDHEHLHSYRELCRFPAEQAVPLTYPHLLAFPLHLMMMADDEFPWSAFGVEPLSTVIKQHAAISPHDTVRIEVGCGLSHHHERGQAVSLDTHIFRAGQLMWESRVIYLKPNAPAVPGGGIRHVEALPPSAGLVRGARWALPADLGRDYARLSGDFNPVYLNPWVAKLFGFPRTIAPGMWTTARALAGLMPRGPIETAELRADFKLPLLLPGEATLWTVPGPLDSFEVRNASGTKPYLRGRFKLIE